MALTDNDIRLFATSTFEQMGEKPAWATNAYFKAQAEVRESGYRVTRRVKDILWETLVKIEEEARKEKKVA